MVMMKHVHRMVLLTLVMVLVAAVLIVLMLVSPLSTLFWQFTVAVAPCNRCVSCVAFQLSFRVTLATVVAMPEALFPLTAEVCLGEQLEGAAEDYRGAPQFMLGHQCLGCCPGL